MKRLAIHRSRRRIAAGGLIAVAPLVAACGSTAHSGTTAIGTAAAALSHHARPIATTRGSAGTYLVGTHGRAIYLWEADTTNKSRCTGACAAVWPAVTVPAGTRVTGTVASSRLGTIPHSGGTRQVTDAGHPLYYYAGDPHAGTTTGQGNDGFGAKWWLVSPGGAAITGHNPAVTPAASTTTGSGGW